ncbi:MAG TPA: cytochrome c [Polyangiaceae bacterium]|nr:cytochrome c [Polyangiaceae bacterium]
MIRAVATLPFLLIAAACGGSAPPVEAPAESAAPEAMAPAASVAPSAAPANFAEQVALGQKVYGAKCAGCHGNSGEGSKDAPAVVGLDKGALPLAPPPTSKYRKTEFKTVADIADFVVKSMPPKAPGSLSAEEYFAILAFDLKANGIDLGDKKLDGALAKTLEVPRK